ncbi:MAG: FimV/HubP family polar landmark protein [Candidatus Competibacteraceae bacterium]
MTRNVFRCWLASLLLGPVCAFALEVGEIQVDSALNQLFDARIPLPTLSPEELGRISVKVASPTMFKEFGLDRGATLDNLVFSIQYDAEGKVYVKVVSIKPIHEPSLALLLEFGWPRGKTFREFTVLLDPVRRLVEQPAAGRTKTVLDTSADTEAESSSEPPPLADIVVNRTIQYPDQPTSSTEASLSGSWVYRPGDVYGPVASGEGLWGIALKVRPDPGITRDQMMQALFQANPDAFSKVGVDGLRIGALLRIPTFQEIADFTGSAVARQLAATEKAAAEKAEADDAETGIASTGGASAGDGTGSGSERRPSGRISLGAASAPGRLPPVPDPKPVFISEPAVVAVPNRSLSTRIGDGPGFEPKPGSFHLEPTVLAALSRQVSTSEPAAASSRRLKYARASNSRFEPKPEVSTSEPATAASGGSRARPATVCGFEPSVSTIEPAVVAIPESQPEVPESAWPGFRTKA